MHGDLDRRNDTQQRSRTAVVQLGKLDGVVRGSRIVGQTKATVQRLLLAEQGKL
jgi:hypothetical protein